MKKYFSILFNPQNRNITLGLLLTGAVFVMVATSIGISDNAPGIILLFIGLVLLMLALVHFWRKERSYLILLVVCFAGGILFAILHNLLDALATKVADITFLAWLAEVSSAASFIIAVMICPVGVLLGFFGAILTYFLKRNPKKAAE